MRDPLTALGDFISAFIVAQNGERLKDKHTDSFGFLVQEDFISASTDSTPMCREAKWEAF